MFETKNREINSERHVDISLDQSLLLINRYREQFEKLVSIGLFVFFVKSLKNAVIQIQNNTEYVYCSQLGMISTWIDMFVFISIYGMKFKLYYILVSVTCFE